LVQKKDLDNIQNQNITSAELHEEYSLCNPFLIFIVIFK
jgi:hypothetical protein